MLRHLETNVKVRNYIRGQNCSSYSSSKPMYDYNMWFRFQQHMPTVAYSGWHVCSLICETFQLLPAMWMCLSVGLRPRLQLALKLYRDYALAWPHTAYRLQCIVAYHRAKRYASILCLNDLLSLPLRTNTIIES